jgi:hypothetical protein
MDVTVFTISSVTFLGLNPRARAVVCSAGVAVPDDSFFRSITNICMSLGTRART